jgi:hypothetical protein
MAAAAVKSIGQRSQSQSCDLICEDDGAVFKLVVSELRPHELGLTINGTS